MFFLIILRIVYTAIAQPSSEIGFLGINCQDRSSESFPHGGKKQSFVFQFRARSLPRGNSSSRILPILPDRRDLYGLRFCCQFGRDEWRSGETVRDRPRHFYVYSIYTDIYIHRMLRSYRRFHRISAGFSRIGARYPRDLSDPVILTRIQLCVKGK